MNVYFVLLKLYMLNACCVLVQLHTAQQDPSRSAALQEILNGHERFKHTHTLLYNSLGHSLTSEVSELI